MVHRFGQLPYSLSLANARLMRLNWEIQNPLSVERMGCKTETAGCHLSTTRIKPKNKAIAENSRVSD